ncbi:MAG: hypothetical protein ABJN65_01800 [Parasphingorhabdus sp.]
MKQPDLQPTLVGTLAELHPTEGRDCAEMHGAGSDPLIFAVHPAKERYKESNFREYFDGAIQSGSAFTILLRKNGAIIGSRRYDGFDGESCEIEIGWTFLVRSVSRYLKPSSG